MLRISERLIFKDVRHLLFIYFVVLQLRYFVDVKFEKKYTSL